MYKGRKFLSERIYDKNGREVLVRPNENSYIVNEGYQTLEVKPGFIKDKVLLELKKNDIFLERPEFVEKIGEYYKYQWTFLNGFGDYHLLGYINNSLIFDFNYYYYNNITLNDPPKKEKYILDELDKLINNKN